MRSTTEAINSLMPKEHRDGWRSRVADDEARSVQLALRQVTSVIYKECTSNLIRPVRGTAETSENRENRNKSDMLNYLIMPASRGNDRGSNPRRSITAHELPWARSTRGDPGPRGSERSEVPPSGSDPVRTRSYLPGPAQARSDLREESVGVAGLAAQRSVMSASRPPSSSPDPQSRSSLKNL